MSELENSELESLENCLNKDIKEIFVTGYSEIRENHNYFSSMSFYYIKFEPFFLCVSTDPNIGVLKLNIQKEIQSDFEIERGDVFTISTVNNVNYSGQKVVSCDVFFGNDDKHIYAVGIQLEDNKFVHKHHKYISFSCLSFDGIIFGGRCEIEDLLKDDRFRLVNI